MAKKQTKQAAPVVETTSVAVIEAPAPQPEAAAPRQAFRVNEGREFKPRRGFETALYGALSTEPLTESEVIRRLLDSGEYPRVAPRAAGLRPVKPVRFLLKQWSVAGIVTTA